MIADLVFFALAAVTLLGAFCAVALPKVFYNALSLILCLFGMAGLFIYLQGEFVAVMQVIVYVGAVSIAIIFAIMLSQPRLREKEQFLWAKSLRAALAAAAFGGVLWAVLRQAPWNQAPPDGDYSIRMIGQYLLGPALLPFEAVSIVLLVAIVGALLISSGKEAR